MAHSISSASFAVWLLRSTPARSHASGRGLWPRSRRSSPSCHKAGRSSFVQLAQLASFFVNPPHHGVGRGHAGRGCTAVAAAARVGESDSPFQRDRALQHDQGHRLHALVAQLFSTGPFHSRAGGAERLEFPQNAQLSRGETGCRKSFARTVKLALKTQAP